MQRIKNKIKKLPDSPGVYFFLKGKKILYIGKATSLRDRVRSYMSKEVFDTRGPLIEKMLNEFTDIKFQKTDSVLEALVLEAHLIKKHQPEANILEKDDRSFNFVVITKEDWPRVLVMRGKELKKENNSPPLATLGPSLKLREGKGRVSPVILAKQFGPFTNGAQLKQAMKIVRRLFPFRDKCIPAEEQKPHPALPLVRGGKTRAFLPLNKGKVPERRMGSPCFNRQIGLCPGVCSDEISKEDYRKQIRKIVLFFEGNKTKLINSLKKEMRTFSNSREYENAGKIKRQIFALYHIQDISLIKAGPMSRVPLDTKTFRIESYDIAHLSGTNVVGAMTVVEDGEAKKSDYRKFKIKNDPGINDTKALSEMLTRRLNHTEWPMPDLIVVDGGTAQKRVAEHVLNKNKINIPVVSVVKDERHKPKGIIGIERLKNLKIEDLERQILLSNAEAHRFTISFHKKLRGKLF